VLSLRCNGTGTAAQGIFFDAEDGGTTGKILNLRNNGTEMLVLTATGQLQIPSTSAQNAGIVLGGDAQLYRTGAKVLKAYNTTLYAYPGTAGTTAFYTNNTVTSVGPTTSNFRIENDGKQSWGPGDAVLDTYLYRSDVNALKTDGAFTAGTILDSGQSPIIKTASFSITTNDTSFITNSASTITVTLPTPTAGKTITIMNKNTGTVVSASSNVYPRTTLTLGTAILAGTAGAWVDLVADGTNWYIVRGA
jgi:hypothetical protein